MLDESGVGALGIGCGGSDEGCQLVGRVHQSPSPFKGFPGGDFLDLPRVDGPPSLKIGGSRASLTRACSNIPGGMGGGVRIYFIGGAGKGGVTLCHALSRNVTGVTRDIPAFPFALALLPKPSPLTLGGLARLVSSKLGLKGSCQHFGRRSSSDQGVNGFR